MKKNIFETSRDAYIGLNKFILENGQDKSSRIGFVKSVNDIAFSINNPTEEFIPEELKRIKCDYAQTFWNFMISGGTSAEEAFTHYPGVTKFISKPKSKELPENFNTFYGPRIVEQLPEILSELKTNPDTRRAMIMILDSSDRLLLDKDETLEYPCTSSINFRINNNKLESHVHMRSQNTAVVFQLDLFLQFKLLEFIAKELNLEIGSLNFSMVDAHIFSKDINYITDVINTKF